MKDLFLFFAFFFTSCTRWGLLSYLANANPSSSLIWSGFESLHLLNARLWDFIFFHIFLIFLLAELSELIISCPSCHVFLCISFLFLFFPWHILALYLPLFHFVIVHWSIVNHAARLLWFTLFTIVSSLKGTVET